MTEGESLDIARGLAKAGIPVFVAYPDPEGTTASGRATGYALRKGWQTTTPNPAYVNAWKPGLALCAVMGCGLDDVDVDPRNGGDLAALDGILPEVLGEAVSPSGGPHLFVATIGVRSRDGVLPGIDVKAGDASGEGRGFAFIAPTVRVSKTTGERAAYRWTRPPDLSRLGTGDPDCKLAALVCQARGKTGTGFSQPGGHSEGWTDPDIAQLIREGIPAGEAQQPILRDVVARLVGKGYDRTVCWGIWQAIADRTPLTRPEWPWAEDDFADMYDSAASKYGTRPRGPREVPEAEPAGAQVLRLADVEPERITWLWNGYLPLGKQVTLDGDPGVGKSTVTADIAARITTGSPMPDGTAPVKGAVLILSAEDGLADTIRPRLDAAGADPTQVLTITGITSYSDDGEPYSRPVVIPRDLPVVEQVIRDHGVVLLVVDVLMAYLSGDVNSHRDQDIRRALHVLATMADRTGCCVIVLRHLNKTTGGNALYRGGGSIGIIGAARAGYMCGTDPDDETGQLRVFACVKLNLAPQPPALAYHLVNDELHGCARVVWDGISEHRASTLLAEPASDDDRDGRTERDEAAEWLRDYLIDNGGEASPGDAKKAAREAGIAPRTMERARTRAHVKLQRSGFPARSLWVLDLTVSPQSRQPRQSPGADETGETGGETGGWDKDSISAVGASSDAPVADTLSGIGPCAWCGQPCTRYGDHGKPLCDSCEGSAQ
jgi:hypothetical protein